MNIRSLFCFNLAKKHGHWLRHLSSLKCPKDHKPNISLAQQAMNHKAAELALGSQRRFMRGLLCFPYPLAAAAVVAEAAGLMAGAKVERALMREGAGPFRLLHVLSLGTMV